MRDVVRQHFVPFTLPLEGALGGGYIGIPWMYQDVKGLVSTGLGNLIDPIPLAIGLPWVRLDGTPAPREEIVEEWARIKHLPPDAHGRTAAMLGHLYAKPHARLRLTPVGIEQLVQRKLNENEAIIRATFPAWEEWPADAQLATHSMAWACGAGIFSPRAGKAHWPKLTAALHAQDFRTAAVECFMPEEKTIGGLRPRNKANRILYTNAAIAMRMFDPAELYYPTDLDNPVQSERTLEVLPESEPTVVVDAPEMRPDPFEAQIIHPKVPLGRPALDDDEEPDGAA